MEFISRYDPYLDSGPMNCDCKGGGGSSSGKVSYPAYMQDQHETWMDEIAVLITSAISAGSPVSGVDAFDPATDVTAMNTAVSAFGVVVAALSNEDDWESATDAAVAKIDAAVIDDTYVTADIVAYADVLDDQIVDDVLPAFQTGMRDINAVYSSSFVMGEARIYASRDRDVAKYSSELRLKLNFQRNEMIKASVDTMISSLSKFADLKQSLLHYTLEARRLGIVAYKEEADQNVIIDDADARWDLDVYQYGANMLAGIGGGVSRAGGQTEMSKTQSAMGGALAGASMGAAVGGPAGAGIGAIVGGIAGLLG